MFNIKIFIKRIDLVRNNWERKERQYKLEKEEKLKRKEKICNNWDFLKTGDKILREIRNEKVKKGGYIRIYKNLNLP